MSLWEATSQNLKHKAVGGLGAARYRLTDEFLFVETGTLRSDSQQVRVADVIDIDMRQSLTQKARNVGDLVVRVRRPDGTETITLDSVPDPRTVHQLLNEATRARRVHEQHVANVYTHVPATPTAVSPPPPVGPPAGWYADPSGVGGQRWWDGVQWTDHRQ